MVAPNEDLSATAQGRHGSNEPVLKAYASVINPDSKKEVYLVFDSTVNIEVPNEVRLCLESVQVINGIFGVDVVSTQETLPEYKDLNGVMWEFINTNALTPDEALKYLTGRYPSATWFQFVSYAFDDFALINPRYDEINLTGFVKYAR